MRNRLPVRIITINGRRGDRPDFVDSVTVRGGEVVATAPIQDADQLPLDDITIRLDALPLDRLEALVDTALTDFGEDDAFVTTITVALTNGVPTIEIGIESARRTGSAAFDLNGNLMGVPR